MIAGPPDDSHGARPMRDIVAQLAPRGVLRAGINLANTLLVSGRTAGGNPAGVAPDLAAEVATLLGVPVAYVPFATPGELADAVGRDLWDVGFVAAEPARAEAIAFTAPYVEIEATYLVHARSPLKAVSDVDRPGTRIAVMARSAYDLWLTRNLGQAQLVREDSHDAARQRFLDGDAEVLAGLKVWLLAEVDTLPGVRVLPGHFTAVQQAIGTARANTAGAAFLAAFVEEAKASGLVARLIRHHRVKGLSVGPPQPRG